MTLKVINKSNRFFYFFIFMDKPIEDILEKWCLNGNPKHTWGIHESPKDKNASTHQPPTRTQPINKIN